VVRAGYARRIPRIQRVRGVVVRDEVDLASLGGGGLEEAHGRGEADDARAEDEERALRRFWGWGGGGHGGEWRGVELRAGGCEQRGEVKRAPALIALLRALVGERMEKLAMGRAVGEGVADIHPRHRNRLSPSSHPELLMLATRRAMLAT
jgi:hypothetical protein